MPPLHFMVLLIWDDGLGDVKLYELNGDHADGALKCDGHYINDLNTPDDSYVWTLNDLLENMNEMEHPSVLRFGPHGPYEAIVRCGFIP